MIIKVCGMRNSENIKELSRLPISYMGLIFYSKSDRYVDDKTSISSPIPKIGVFVNAKIEEIKAKVLSYNLNGVQLHGDENVEYCIQLKRELRTINKEGLLLIKAFRVTESLRSEDINKYNDVVDLYILDSGGKKYGGNGVKWNYKLIGDLELKKDFLLSGGIDDDVELEKLVCIDPRCVGVDLNSKFEIEAGFKDIKKLENFIKKSNYE